MSLRIPRSFLVLFVSTGAQGLVSLTNFALVVVATHVLTAGEVGYYVLALSTINFVSGFVQSINVESLAMESRTAESLADSATRATVIARAVLIAVPIALVAGVIGTLALPALLPLIIATALVMPCVAVVDSHRLWLLATRSAPRAIRWDLPWVFATFILIGVAARLQLGLTPSTLLICYGIPLVVTAFILLVRTPLRAGMTSPESTVRRHYRNLSIEYLINQAVNQTLLFAVGFRLGAPDAAAFRTSQNLFGPLNILLNASRAALFPSLSHSLGNSGRVRQWLKVSMPFVLLTAVALVAVLLLGSVFGHLVLGVTADEAVPLLPALGLQYVALIVQTAGLIALRATQNSAFSATARSLQAVIAASAGAVGLIAGDLQVLVWALAIGAVLSALIWVAFAVRSLTRQRPLQTSVIT